MAKESLNPADQCFWKDLNSSKNMTWLKSPAEINENQVNMPLYTEVFNGAQQRWLVVVEREECILFRENGFVPNCSRPKKMKIFSFPKRRCSIPAFTKWNRVDFILLFFTETYQFQSPSNSWPLLSPGSAGRCLETLRTLASLDVCESCRLPGFQQVN